MKKILFLLTFLLIICPSLSNAQTGQQCIPEKILSVETVNAILVGYFIESNTVSDAVFNINGKEMRLYILDEEKIDKQLNGNEDKKFQITIEKVFGNLIDGCEEYSRITNAKLIK